MTLADCLAITCACGLAPLVIVFVIRGIAGYKPE
jgi:hypothetical protein